MYLFLNLFKKNISKYSKFEEVENVDQIKNALIRETLLEYSDNPDEPIEVNSFADVPSGTGLDLLDVLP